MPSLRKCGRLLESFTLQGCLSETESVDEVMCSVGCIQQSLGPESECSLINRKTGLQLFGVYR